MVGWYGCGPSPLERGTTEGDSPVWAVLIQSCTMRQRVELLGNAALMGGKLHPRLNRGGRPIANKYREGKMKSTLKRE